MTMWLTDTWHFTSQKFTKGQHLPKGQGIVSVGRWQLGKIARQAAIGFLKFQLTEAVDVKIVWFVISESP